MVLLSANLQCHVPMLSSKYLATFRKVKPESTTYTRHQFALFKVEAALHSCGTVCKSHRMETTGKNQPTDSMLFLGVKDHYNGLTVTSCMESCDTLLLPSKLKESLQSWASSNVRTVWFRVSIEQADWVPILAQNGFKFHHTKGQEVMMYKWLPTSEECNIPPYAHTMVGVGAVVINSSEELLIVRERFHKAPHWKLPGGYVEPGENIADAAVREVLEETNIKTEFQSLLCFRHMHNANFKCSDLYFIANLKPLSSEIEKSDQEIDACVWMKIEDFLKHPQVHEGNRNFLMKYLESINTGKSIGCVQGLHPVINRQQCVFSLMDIDNIPKYKHQNPQEL